MMEEFKLNTIIKIEKGIDYIREIPYETVTVGFYNSNNVYVKLATYDSRNVEDTETIEILKEMHSNTCPNENKDDVKMGDECTINVYGQKLDDVREINRLNDEIKKLKGIIGDLYIERCNLYETIEDIMSKR